LYIIIIDSLQRLATPADAIQIDSDNNANTPNTRKKKIINYYILQNYRFQGRPNSPSIQARKKIKSAIPLSSSQPESQPESQLESQFEFLQALDSNDDIIKKGKDRKKRR
jgi:hypothetical protein